MINANWKPHPPHNDYSDDSDWLTGVVPGTNDTAIFGKSSRTKLITTDSEEVGGWTFQKGAPRYTISLNLEFHFNGAGIVVHGAGVQINEHFLLLFDGSSSAGTAHIAVSDSVIFSANSSAGRSVIDNHSALRFAGNSSADHAKITNTSSLAFAETSNAANATITNVGHASTEFSGQSDAGQARLIARAGTTFDFSFTGGPGGSGVVHAGSIEGAGTYKLGHIELVVGNNNRSTKVTGEIDDGGENNGTGAVLAKTGTGKLTLTNAHNNYSGGTIISQGTLAVAVDGATGAGNIIFSNPTSKKSLIIQNKALDHHQFTTEIQSFDFRSVIDLAGLKFVKGAKVTYNEIDGILKVKSGHATDSLTQFFNPFDTHFKAKSDGHGGTKIVLVAPGAKPAGHDDGFHFKSDVSHARHVPSGPDPIGHTPVLGAYLHGDAPISVIAEIFSHHDAATFAHHGDLFA